MASDFAPFIVHLLLVVVAPPFFLGVIAKTKAFFAGRRGPPFLQAYYDIFKLLQKSTVLSRSSSAILHLAPAVILSSIFFAALFVPLWGGTSPLHFEGDVVLFAYLLALARFATILAAMDVGSSFEGMGASREATFGALTELAFFLGLIVLAVMTHSTSLTGIFAQEGTHPFLHPALLLLFVAFFLVLLTENSRMPIDDPSTHLELTMIHEVMILDYGGPDLGVILYAASMKLFVFMALTISILWPQTGLGWILLKVTGMAVAVGITESVMARLRLIKIPQLLTANFVVVALALLVMLLGRRI